MKRAGITNQHSFLGLWPGAELGTNVTVREGVVKIKARKRIGPLFAFEGKIFFGADRVYGIFTKGTTPEGEEFLLCAELTGHDGQRGQIMEEAPAADSAVIHSSVYISPSL
jgi:hypothetical protein